MWKHIFLSFYVLLQAHNPKAPPFCSASTVQNSTAAAPSTLLPTTTTSALFSASTVASPHATSSLNASSTAATSLPSASLTTFASSSVSTTSVTATSSGNASTSSTTTVTAAQSTPSIDPSTLKDIQTLQARRITSIVAAMGSPASIPAWLSTLGSDGKWPDSEVNYTTGCPAQRANWPAQDHWQRILIMAGAWHGGLKGADQFVHDTNLRNSISNAMNYWFGRDFKNLACLDSGGTAACPCDNVDNSLWNTNWFSNIILIPELVGQTCLLLNDTLVQSQVNNCTHMTLRSYGTFDHNINGVGTLTGANALDVSKIGIDEALLVYNASLVTDAYRRVHLELQIKNGIKADGIRADGSFGQHAGMLYNGNYGKDYTNDVVDLEVEAGGTQFAAGADSKTALATLFNGDRWMIFLNTITGVLHWDFSALGRFISFPVIDAQATESIKLNLTEIRELGQLWSSDDLISFADDLTSTTNSANAGQLQGNNMFYANDYMVQRGANYVTTVKMYSTRTQNTECTNSQNPEGFHLSDGVVYTYLQGNEYEDISAAWDWNLIPGITIDYNATSLVCGTTQQTGIESFVGGVSDGNIGAAAMRYTNPVTKSFHFQKAWFFLNDDVQHVMISGITSTTGAPVYSVLDQRRFAGSVIINGQAKESMSNAANVQTLWHGNVGYVFPPANSTFTFSTETGNKTGAWSVIGTSTQPPATVNLFAAWIHHNTLSAPMSYTALPGTSHDVFVKKSQSISLQAIQNDQHISGIYDANNNVAMLVFWDAKGATTTINPKAPLAPIKISSNANLAVIYKFDSGEITVSDPSQSLTTAQLVLTLGTGRKPPHWASGQSKTLVFQLPSGGLAGSNVTQTLT